MIGYYKRTLVNLFYKIQEIRSDPWNKAELCFEIQESLLRKITIIEGKIRKSKLIVFELKGELRYHKPKSEVKILKLKIEKRLSQIDEYKNVLFIFKSVGDALAYIFISKWDIKPMVYKQEPGFISKKKGTRLERSIFRDLFKNGYICIFNDLTNSLRYGDITVVFPEYFKMIEVKSGKRRYKRDYRQIERLQRLNSYLINDQVEDLYKPGQLIRRISLNKKEKNYIGLLNESIESAKRTGYTVINPEQGLTYIVEFINNYQNSKVVQVSSQIDSPIVYLLNMDAYKSQGYLPTTLLIHDPLSLFKYYSGNLFISIIVDKKMVSKLFQRKGYTISFLDDAGCFFEIKNNKPKHDSGFEFLRVSQHFFSRIAFECLSLTWFIDHIVSMTKPKLLSKL